MKNKRENGEVIVEASIIVTLVVIFITIMLYIGMVLYQQTLISVMARQTASNIAQVYSNSIKDPFTGYIDSDKVYQSITYSNMKTDAYLDVLEQKAEAFAQYRLKSSRLLAADTTAVDVEIVQKPNELLKSQIIVTIRESYDIPLVGIFGSDSFVEFAASGRADCVDLLEYLNGVAAIGDPENSSVPSLPNSDTCLVTFVVDKYSGGFYAAVPVMRGESIMSSNHLSHSTMPAEPVNNGMRFIGWVTEDGSNFTASNKITENTTVYGNWECAVTFDPDGGIVNPASKTVGIKQTTSFPEPQKDHSVFEGWYTEKNGGGYQYHSNVTEITSNVTLYAKWGCVHEFEWIETEPATCKDQSKLQGTCKYCGYVDFDYGPKVGHSYDGRCGVNHETKSSGYFDDCSEAKKGDRYYNFECIVCKWCGKRKGERVRELKDGSLLVTSDKVWCIEHIRKNHYHNFYEDQDLTPILEPEGGHKYTR